MDIARYAIRNPMQIWLLILISVCGGLFAYFNIERLEDPAFTIRQAVVVTMYPGASAERVEREVSDVLESAVQRMSQLEEVRSTSRPGYSELRVEVRDTYDGAEMPQIWNELRNKIADAAGSLPPGALQPMVNDDFGDVFGIYYAVTGDGLTDTEVHDALKTLRRGLLATEGVGAIEFAGVAEERVIVEVPQSRLSALGLSPQEIGAALTDAEQEIAGGGVRSGDLHLRVMPSGAYDSAESLRALTVGEGQNRIRLGDLAEIRREFEERPSQIVRYDGQPAITLAIAGLDAVNIVDVGKAVDAALDRLLPTLPAGIELHPIYLQPEVVDSAINSFVLNLILSIVIVIGIICGVMGLRSGLIIGAVVAFSVTGTLLVMLLMGVELERVSLAALLIAMGMLVDNALVIQDSMQVKLKQGRSAVQAASDSLRATQWPLLGATVIGILAFAGIGLSQDSTGEFLGSLFIVITVSLLLSWIFAVTVVPLFGTRWAKAGTDAGRRDAADRQHGDPDAGPQVQDDESGNRHAAEDPAFQSRFFGGYRRALRWSLSNAWFTIGIAGLLTVVCVFGFTRVPQSFFPPSSLPIGLVNVHIRQGADIRATEDVVAELEAWLVEEFEELTHVVSFVGSGAHRFMLTYAPERPDPSYAQIMLMVDDFTLLEDIVARYNERVGAHFPEIQTFGYQMVFGANPEARIEARFVGPDAEVLRALSVEAQAIMSETGLFNVRDDWREREIVLRPELDLERMAEVGVSREDVSQALMLGTEGLQLAVVRENDEQRPVLLRVPADERADPTMFASQMVWSSGSQRYVPLSQVTEGLVFAQEEAVTHRRDRERALNVRGEPPGGVEASVARDGIAEAIEAIALPPGYRMVWGGVHEASSDSSAALMSTLGLPYLAMILITMVLFGGVRQSVVIWLVVPMAICGVTIGLLVSGIPFGFMALLGLLSLTGLLLKNAIVLVEEIDRRIADGAPRRTAIVEGATSRLSPVSLLCATTVAGMIPLLFDQLFDSMAVTIMGGLLFATVLTLFVVPALYLKVFRVTDDETVESGA